MNLLTGWLTSEGCVTIVVYQGISVDSALDLGESEAEGTMVAIAAEVVGLGVVVGMGVAVLGMLPEQM